MRYALALALAATACTGDLEKRADANEKAIGDEATRAHAAEDTLTTTLDELTTRLAALDALEERVTTLEAELSTQASALAALDTRVGTLDAALTMHAAESYFVWDGDGRYLGQLLDLYYSYGGVDPASLVFIEPVSRRAVSAALSANAHPPGVPGTRLYFTSANCSGGAITGTYVGPITVPLPVLVQASGVIYAPTLPVALATGRAIRSSLGVGPGATCQAENATMDGYAYAVNDQFVPFTEGVYAGPAAP